MNYREKFYELLKNMFVGAKIEGQSGYINLMKIKDKYFNKVLLPKLETKVNHILSKYPRFENELFEKLYTFFSRYFSENGSIHFVNTPYYHQIYDRIYTDKEDVILFWKTKDLYYVKTDRIFNSMEVEEGEYKFYFDVSALEHKKGNEKKEIIFELDEEKTKHNFIVFNVYYPERNRQTNIEKILESLKKKKIIIAEDILKKVFAKFIQQSEVDYFIHKNAKEFLEEQLKLYIYNYFFKDQTDWTEDRINQINEFKEVAKIVVDYVSAFENELVKIWNKPRFVLNSNYVITLDRIIRQNEEKGLEIIKQVLNHENFSKQLKEWKKLEIITEDFNKDEVIIKNSGGETINETYKFLPIDTKYFKDLELEILQLFDDLDNQLDGWLIKSENYQALNTILKKFREKVTLIYIDPPFNTGSDFAYKDKFQDSTWLTLMKDRIDLSISFLRNEGSYYLHLDENANFFGKILMYETFGKQNYKRHIVWDKALNPAYRKPKKNYVRQKDDIYFYAVTEDYIFNAPVKVNEEEQDVLLSYIDKKSLKHFLIFMEGDRCYFEIWDKNELKKIYLDSLKKNPVHIGTIWNDIWDFDFSILADEYLKFKTQKPELLLYRIISTSSNQKDLVLDFFLGIGTTIAVAHKLNRRWIGIECGEHFYDFYCDKEGEKIGILGRMKRVLSGEKGKNILLNNMIKWKGGGFFKYFELEQYEDILRKTKYLPSKDVPDLFNEDFSYIFMPDPKLLDALVVDTQKNKFDFDFSKIYPNVDVVETISFLFGKKVKKVAADHIIFEDGEKLFLNDLQKYTQQIKNLIWW
ncbi:MAG: DNA methyltransferase [Nitrososphaeria archaeon]